MNKENMVRKLSDKYKEMFGRELPLTIAKYWPLDKKIKLLITHLKYGYPCEFHPPEYNESMTAMELYDVHYQTFGYSIPLMIGHWPDGKLKATLLNCLRSGEPYELPKDTKSLLENPEIMF